MFHADAIPRRSSAACPTTAASARTGAWSGPAQVVIRFPDREETFHAGDAYYVVPGHLPLVFAGTEVVEFSPTEQLQATMAVLGANIAAQEPVR